MPTKAQNKATAKYKKANYKRIPLEIPLDQFGGRRASVRENKKRPPGVGGPSYIPWSHLKMISSS